MRIKLDGNLGRRGADELAAVGHDVTTVAEQGLAGIGDRDLIRHCLAEARVLKLWIVETGRIREYQPPVEADDE